MNHGTRLQRWEMGCDGNLGLKPQAVMECAFGAERDGQNYRQRQRRVVGQSRVSTPGNAMANHPQRQRRITQRQRRIT